MSSDDKERGSDSSDFEVAATLLEEPLKEHKEADSDYEDDARDPQPYRLDPSAPEIGIAISALKALALTSRNRQHVTLQKEAGIATSNGVLYSHAVLVYLEHVVDGDGSTAVSEKIAEFSLGARSPSLVHTRGLTIRHLALFFVYHGHFPTFVRSAHVKTKSLLDEYHGYFPTFVRGAHV